MQLPAVETLKRTICKHQKVVNWPIPLLRDRKEIEIPPQYQHTSALQHDSGGDDVDRIMMFAAARTLDILSNAKHTYKDSTFKIVSELFFQLYTIHTLGPGGFFVPCLYALLPNKS